MDTNLYSAFNKGSNRVLSPRLVVVDAAREPEKALKTLMEGPANSARTGIWLINFNGFPVVRANTDFDLVYLDQHHCVLHAVEMSEDGEFEPLRQQTASALILQPKTIDRSRTFTGDRITLDPTEHRMNEAESDPASKRTLQFPARVTPAAAPTTFNVPSETSADSPVKKAPPSGRLMKGRGTRASGSILGLQSGVENGSTDLPKAAPGVPSPKAASPQETTQRKPQRPAPAAPSNIERGAKRLIAPIPHDESSTISAAEVASAFDRPLATHSFPSANIAPPESAQKPARKQTAARKTENASQAQVKASKTAPSILSTPDIKKGGAELAKISGRIRSWLSPSSHSEKKPHNRRRAPRIADPGLVGYYFAGGPPTPHEIRNLSAMGFYMVTNQRWMPGTVLRVTLQPRASAQPNSADSVTVLSRVVSFGPDGTGFEFVLPRI